MKKVLIINGHQYKKNVAEGKLTGSIVDFAKKYFIENNFQVKSTDIDKDYVIKDEVAKFDWADYIFFQYPVFWMGVPWITKKYIDEIFSAGAKRVMYADDGRTRGDYTKKYGTGGLMTEKKYMLSLTYNCPLSEFDNKDGFFEGLTLDEVNYPVHKTFQFCGSKPLETFSIHNIFKGDLNLESELEKLEKILKRNFL